MAINIMASVGRGGTNHKGDVRKIQKLLNAIFPATPVDVDGLCKERTIRRIECFQRRFMRSPDGRVDSGGRTLRRLNQSAPGLQRDWGGDSSKWPPERKLQSLDHRMQLKVQRVTEALKAQGFKPKIVYAWRSVAVQQDLVAQGRSRVRFSFHNAQRRDGSPRAYAADIIDRRWAWSVMAKTNGFWEALGSAAKREGLFWGGDWRSFKDWAHIQFHPNRILAEVKRESGLA